MSAAFSDVDDWRTRERPAAAQGAHVWGPVKARDAAVAGCSRGVESLCIKPAVPPLVVAAALGCVPTAVRPNSTDTLESLRMRLGRSTFLDDAIVLRGGNGKRKRGQAMRVRLNDTDYRAPRRKSWSVVVEAERTDADGDSVVTLFNYNAYGRTAEDVCCSPIPMPVFALGLQLWLAALPHLCEESRCCCPPTHCQLLFYYTIFNSAMGELSRDTPATRRGRTLVTHLLRPSHVQVATMTITPSSTHAHSWQAGRARRDLPTQGRRTLSASALRFSCTPRATPIWILL